MKRIIISVILLAIVLFSCSKPPEKERSLAEKALSEAQNAGAAQWAPETYRDAMGSWQLAEKLAEDKKYKEAREIYIKCAQIAIEARDATRKARAEAERIKEEPQSNVPVPEKQIREVPTETIAQPEEKIHTPQLTDYTVKKGDYLWKIAGYPEVYGNPEMFGKLYYANQKKIKNCNKIYPGMVLKIPRN